jgi:hypothetical protein
MSLPLRLLRRAWLLVPICALGFLVWTNASRIRDVGHISDSPDWSVDPLKPDDKSPTGYAGGERRMIVPGHDNYAYQRIAQTQQMFALGQLRVRHVDYENAPIGREVIAPSPYRWWLGLVSLCDSALTGKSIGLSVEHAALYADPLFAALLLLATAIFVAWRFGGFSAAMVSAGFVALYPFAGSFLPGEPDDFTLMLAGSLWSVLTLLAGVRATSQASARRWFWIAGVVAGLGFWAGLTSELFILGGIVLGALLAALIARGDPARAGAARPYQSLPWRQWGLGAGATVLAAYLIDYFPARIGPGLEIVNPLVALALAALGELLGFATDLVAGSPAAVDSALADGPGGNGLRRFALPGLSAAVVAGVSIAIALRPHRMIFEMDPVANRLTNLGEAGVVADGFAAWVSRDGLAGAAAATCLPLLLCLPALAWIVYRGTDRPFRALLALALGPVAAALALSLFQIHWWNTLDGVLLALLAGLTAEVPGAPSSRLTRWLSAGLAAFVLFPGVLQLIPPRSADGRPALSQVDLQGIIERDLAHWIAKHSDAPGAVVLASPSLTITLCYHGGLAGLGTLNWENLDGIKGSIRIAAATEPEEALALTKGRKVKYIVIPSWDMFLDKLASTGLGLAPNSREGIERSFVGGMLAQIQLPTWIELVPYRLPPELGDRWVMIFKVVDEQDPAAALSRTAEYFVEMGYVDRAGVIAQRLRRYPASVAALVARAQVEKARNDNRAFSGLFKTLLFFIARGDDKALPFDRRVSLAITLVQGGRADLAGAQVRRCMDEVDEARLRSLSTASLFFLQKLGKAFDCGIADPRLHALALDLLPPDLRSQI